MKSTEKFVIAMSQMKDEVAKKHLERALRDKVAKKFTDTMREQSKKLS